MENKRWFLKKQNKLLYDPTILLLGMCPKELKWGQKEVFADCVHNISHTSWEVEVTQCLLVDKQRVVCTQNRIFLSLKKGRNAVCYKGDEAWGHNAQWNIELVTKDEYCVIPLTGGLSRSQIQADRKKVEHGWGLMVSCTEYLSGEDEMALEMEIGNSCATMWMNLLYLNCAPKNAQNGRFYVVCVLPPIFKSCRDSKGLSRNTALLKAVSATKPGGSLPAACEYRGVSEIMYKSRGSFVRKLPAGCQRVCEYKNHAEGPPLCRSHLPISLPSLHPPPLFHSLRLFKHDAKDILKSWIH